jgi:NCS1 family nucleobase:cation symporter-1
VGAGNDRSLARDARRADSAEHEDERPGLPGGSVHPLSCLRAWPRRLRGGDDKGGNPVTVTEDYSEDLAVIHDPESKEPFHVEQHGIDFIPESERWATPRDIGGMWAGASVQIEYFIYGAILMTFGLTFAQVVIIIVLGNLSFFLLGLCSLQGPNAGTTVFAINRAPFGPNGGRPISFFNWITQIGFEVEGLILIVGSGLVLMIKAGYLPGDPAKVILVILAVLVQGILPFLGHAAIVKTLRWLVLPFVILFAILLGFAVPHANLQVVKVSGDWQAFMEALAFTIALSGLGWTENGNDYTRYCPTNTSKKGIIGWVFLGTAVPEILIMTLGAVVGTFVLKIGTGAGGLLPFAHTSAIPAWFVVVFLLFAIVQIFGINSLDMYSSGVTLQAIGVPVKRYQAVLVDCVIALGVTMYAIFSASFTQYLSDFVDIVIIWIAPWSAIFLVDWALRRYRYVPSELQKTGRDSLYWRSGGIHWPAWVAQLLGMFAAVSGLSATFHLPTWMNEVTYHTRDAYGFGADFSVFMGMGVGALVYLVLALRGVGKEADAQESFLRQEGLLAS